VKVLVAEDNKESRYLLETLLKGHGHEVTAAANGAEALEQALAKPPDIIVSDIMMPEMDGFQLCHECKQNEQLRNIPFIFYTATYTSDEDESFALSLGADAFIPKPTEPDIFVRKLSEEFEKARSQPLAPDKIVPLEPSLYLTEYNKRIVAKLEGTVAELEVEIMERKRVGKSLRQSEEKYRGFFEASKDTVYMTSVEGKIFDINDVGLELFGIRRDDLDKINVGRDIYADPADRAAFIEIMNSAGYTTSHEANLKRMDGTVFSATIAAVTVRDADGSVTGYQGIIRDETERKRAEEELKQSYEKLQEALEGTINALATTTEWRDPYTAGHQQRVTRLACAIAEEMNLSAEQNRTIYMSAMIHDIGKINVPSEILSKPGRLTEPEFQIIQTHPQVGHDILKGIAFPWPIAHIILQHHEKMDGSGYPQGLSGEEIYLEARILCVADVVEAMASHRPYRPALGIDKALEEISQSGGILYDPDVVDACLKIFAEKGFKFK